MTHYVAYSRAQSVISWSDNKRHTNVAEVSVTCWACSTHEVGQECIKDFGGEAIRKRPLERLRSTRDNKVTNMIIC